MEPPKWFPPLLGAKNPSSLELIFYSYPSFYYPMSMQSPFRIKAIFNIEMGFHLFPCIPIWLCNQHLTFALLIFSCFHHIAIPCKHPLASLRMPTHTNSTHQKLCFLGFLSIHTLAMFISPSNNPSNLIHWTQLPMSFLNPY
jgi:hypothetical protein